MTQLVTLSFQPSVSAFHVFKQSLKLIFHILALTLSKTDHSGSINFHFGNTYAMDEYSDSVKSI